MIFITQHRAVVKLTIIFCGCKIVRNIDVTLFYSLIPIHYVGVKWNILIMTETRHKNIWFCSLIHRSSQFSVGVRCWNRTEVLKLILYKGLCIEHRAASWHKRTIGWSNIYWKLCDLDQQKKEGMYEIRTICCCLVVYIIHLAVSFSLTHLWLLI